LRNDVDPSLLSQTITDLVGFGTRFYPTATNQSSAEYLYRELESYGLAVWYEYFVSWDGYLLTNVIAEIPGRDQTSLYGVLAHFDTISDAPTTSAPGADDNASGVAATLEIARIMAGWSLKHPLRIILVNYEEQGIIGSQEWARDAVARGEPWEGVFNIDSVGSGRNGNRIVLNSEGSSTWMGDLIVRVNDVYGIGESINNAHDPDIMADDNRLRDQGIESVMVARELYGQSPVHHTTNDVMESMSVPHVQGTTVLILLSIGSLMF
jgi:Zn-dependent M28 family amino/carboxypeptidase